MDEGRKRVLGIMAAILASLHMQTADDLFGNPAGTPRTDKLIEASIQWAKRIMQKIDGETKFTSSDCGALPFGKRFDLHALHQSAPMH
jgi:hypothetical protein